MDKVWQIHVDHVVRLDVLIPQVHHHPQQGCVHLLLDDRLITHVVHGHPTLTLHVKILHPCCVDTDSALARLLPCMGGKLGKSEQRIRSASKLAEGCMTRNNMKYTQINKITVSLVTI